MENIFSDIYVMTVRLFLLYFILLSVRVLSLNSAIKYIYWSFRVYNFTCLYRSFLKLQYMIFLQKA